MGKKREMTKGGKKDAQTAGRRVVKGIRCATQLDEGRWIHQHFLVNTSCQENLFLPLYSFDQLACTLVLKKNCKSCEKF